MADYTYRISASGTASGADAGFTTVNAAVSDFTANNRMGAGTGIVAANSTLFIKIDGFLSLGACDVYGIDTTTNGSAVIVVEAWSNPWNATVGRIGYQTSYDGIDFGGSAQANFGSSGSRQANITVRNLIITGSVSGYFPIVQAFGPTTGTASNLLQNLFIRASNSTQAEGVQLDAADIRNCVVYVPNSGGDFVVSSGRANANIIDQCLFVCLGTMVRFVSNGNNPLPLVKNSYIRGNTSSFENSGTWSGSCVGNATDQSAWSGPSGTTFSVALNTTNFENVTDTTEDFRAKAGGALATAGAARLASTTADVFGTSRQDPTTIGVYEALGGGAFTVPADQGSFALTGQTTGLLVNRKLTADNGAYALTGQDATLQKDTPGAFTMPADAGSYSWTGSDALGDYAMNAGSGLYALTGQDVTFTIGVPTAYSMATNPGSYTFNGQNVRLDWSGAPIVPNRQAGIYMGMRIGL